MKLKNRTNRLFFITIILTAFVSLQVSAQDVVRELKDFREVKTFNGVEVIVIPSEENRIEITGHSKEKVKFDVVDYRLELRLSLDNIWSKDNTVITVYGKSIETIDANEGSIVETRGVLEGKITIIRAQEGAAVFAEVNSENVKSRAISGGKITLKGKAREQEVEINSGGHVYARDLKTQNTTVSVSTAGRGEVYASEYVKATAKLGGIVEVFGNPAEVDRKTSLGGKIL